MYTVNILWCEDCSQQLFELVSSLMNNDGLCDGKLLLIYTERKCDVFSLSHESLAIACKVNKESVCLVAFRCAFNNWLLLIPLVSPRKTAVQLTSSRDSVAISSSEHRLLQGPVVRRSPILKELWNFTGKQTWTLDERPILIKNSSNEKVTQLKLRIKQDCPRNCLHFLVMMKQTTNFNKL